MNWGYIAGFLDADGSITLASRRNLFEPRVKFVNTNKKALQKIAEFVETSCKIIIHNKSGRPSHNPNHKTSYMLVLSSFKDIHNVIEHTIKNLIIKKEQATLIQKYLELRETKRSLSGIPRVTWKPGFTYGEVEKEIYEKIKILNLRGGKAHYRK